MLTMPQSTHEQIRRHGEQAYPEESCGVLLGTVTARSREVHEAIPCRNVHPSPATSYEIDLREVIRLQREARDRGLQIVGFYHSHPDHPASPSETDLADAHWLGCSYVITAIVGRRAAETSSFLLTGTREDDKLLAAENVILHHSSS